MGGKIKIMVVEDTNIVARDLQDSLYKLGYLVEEITDSGKEAIQLAEKHRPDLILMDIKLKGTLDGIEAATIIKDQFDIPIIYLTAYADEHTLQRAKRTEPSGYIIKPYKKEELHSVIEMALYKQKMEGYLKKREEFLSTTLKSISDAVITTDVNARVTFINPIAEVITGWGQEEALGKHIDKLYRIIDEKTGHQTENPVIQVLARGKKMTIENHHLITKQNRKISIASDISPIKNDTGRIIGSAIILRDNTEKKKIQDELIKAQKLASLSHIAGSIGHEFNNLLTVIIGNIELMKKTGSLDKTCTEDIEEAEVAAKKAKNLASQLLHFSREEEMIRHPVNIAKLLKDVVNTVTRSQVKRYELILPEDLWQVDADESQLSQVFFNVIKKTFNMIEENGRIAVIAKNMELKSQGILPIDPGRYINITIKEYEKSIPKDQLDGLFDPYFSVEKEPGGIELAIAYSIIKKHNGYITAESVAEEGTNFYIFLPALIIVKEKPRKVPANVYKGKRRILVMDDQELVRIIAGKILNHFGYEVEFARHGDEAIDIYTRAYNSENPFNCVLLDLTVEYGKGAKETIVKLKEFDSNVKAIVSSGYSNDPIFFNYTKYGFKGVIKKPYDLVDLNKTVREVISGK
ncbi:MAG: response regulator [Spirochaetales bacterium]|nr:response regulator [Spirochaetales bacterium]